MIAKALDKPLALSLTGGQVHDISQAETLAVTVEPQAFFAAKGYDADSFIKGLSR